MAHIASPTPMLYPTLPNPSSSQIASLTFKHICHRLTLSDALRSFRHLLASRPSDDLFSPLLELCAKHKSLSHGRQIHAHLAKSHHSVFLSTKLLFMYGNCGSFESAQKLFDRMPERTVFTWNAMIGACLSNGDPLRAVELYREMRELGIPLDSCTFPCVLKACALLGDLRRGAEIHSLAFKCGLDDVSFVANSLVSMYAKCGDLGGARRVFDGIALKEDIVLWNSMISGYSVEGKAAEALGLFRESQRLNVSANSYTFVSALQGCDSGFEKPGMEIHAALLKSSHVFDVYVGNALLAMYVRCGKMVKATRVFNNMERKDNVSNNTMLSGLVQNGLYDEALRLFRDMQGLGKRPDEVAVLNVVAATGRLGNLLNGKEIHAFALKRGLDSNLQIGNTLIDMYARCSRVDLMGSAFARLAVRDFISWTTVIAGYAQNSSFTKALELFHEAQTEGIDVDSLMIESVLMACRGFDCSYMVKEIHCYALRRGLFDLVLRNAMVNVYGEYGLVEYANRMFEQIGTKNVISWTSMLSCYVRNGLATDAFELAKSMKRDDVEPDSIALVAILSAASSLSSLNKGKEIHGLLVRKGFILEGILACSLVDMYANCGHLESAHKAYRCATNHRDIVLWTTMLNAYGMYGCGKKAIELFDMMEEGGLVPDHIAFLAILHACSHSGLIDEGKRYFHRMTKEYKLEPWPEHYACFVDLLGRANRLEEAYQFVNSMESEPTAEIWCAFLGACRVHSNKEFGEIATQKLLELEPKNPGNYVLISNVLASNKRWRDVQKVRTIMKGVGLKKSPGCSWIEIGKKVHVFTARDKYHPESVEIYQKLDQVTKVLEKVAGYVARTQSVLHDVDEGERAEMLQGHSERLAIAYGLIATPEGTPIRITKNLRVCSDCHTFSKLVSKWFERELVVRDANRFHHFKNGLCSCGDFW